MNTHSQNNTPLKRDVGSRREGKKSGRQIKRIQIGTLGFGVEEEEEEGEDRLELYVTRELDN